LPPYKGREIKREGGKFSAARIAAKRVLKKGGGMGRLSALPGKEKKTSFHHWGRRKFDLPVEEGRKKGNLLPHHPQEKGGRGILPLMKN